MLAVEPVLAEDLFLRRYSDSAQLTRVDAFLDNCSAPVTSAVSGGDAQALSAAALAVSAGRGSPCHTLCQQQ